MIGRWHLHENSISSGSRTRSTVPSEQPQSEYHGYSCKSYNLEEKFTCDRVELCVIFMKLNRKRQQRHKNVIKFHFALPCAAAVFCIPTVLMLSMTSVAASHRVLCSPTQRDAGNKSLSVFSLKSGEKNN